MKKLSILLFAVALSACAYVPLSYDSTVYGNLVQMRRQGDLTQAACPSSDSIRGEITKFDDMVKYNVIYLTHTNEAQEVKDSITALNSVVDELVVSYRNDADPGAMYCQFKMTIINHNLDLLVTTIGNRQR